MNKIEAIVETQRSFYKTHKTLDVKYRLHYLKKLYHCIKAHEKDILCALHTDLGKSDTEGFMCEVGLTLSELSYQIKHIRSWSGRHFCHTNLTNFPSVSFTVRDPYGVVLVMAPWNYPFLLTMEPVIGAIAAGNCCVIKPSAYSPATSAIIVKIIREVFPSKYAAVIEGGRAENAELLNQRFDYIFFTGGVTVGKLVMKKASEHLTPVTLELGGKSPCVIDKNADIRLAARRIAFGKFLNCGQTCVAPDYILIDETVKDYFIAVLKEEITKMYGTDPLSSPVYGKMINQKHFDRVCGLIDQEKVVFGGTSDADALKIAPTILDQVTPSDPVMQEEIFGPLLPILTFRSIEEAQHFVLNREKPLAFYLFTKSRKTMKRFYREISFGGGCINDTIMHMTTSSMPFGGVGNSGMGSYHGRKSFETFTHEKSMLHKSTLVDMPMRYAPYRKIWDLVILLLLR